MRVEASRVSRSNAATSGREKNRSDCLRTPASVGRSHRRLCEAVPSQQRTSTSSVLRSVGAALAADRLELMGFEPTTSALRTQRSPS